MASSGNFCILNPLRASGTGTPNFGDLKNIILTASGGPFLKIQHKNLKNITVKDALKHPNWEMGTKITIDSATMMNKGFEVIEAFWLFNLPSEKIEIVMNKLIILKNKKEF